MVGRKNQPQADISSGKLRRALTRGAWVKGSRRAWQPAVDVLRWRNIGAPHDLCFVGGSPTSCHLPRSEPAAQPEGTKATTGPNSQVEKPFDLIADTRPLM